MAENRLFGSMITVSGLLCGDDIAYAAENAGELGEELIIPRTAFAARAICSLTI